MLCVSDVNQKHEEKYNRTSSDIMDKVNQNRHGGEGRGMKSYFLLSIRSEKDCYMFLRVFGLHQKHKTGWK